MQDLALAGTSSTAGPAFDSAEHERLMHLLDLLEAAGTEPQLRLLLDGPMQALLPHRRLLCGTGRVPPEPGGIAPPQPLPHRPLPHHLLSHHLLPHYLLAHGFPPDGLASLRQPGGLLRSLLIDRWLQTRRPVLVDLLRDAASWPAAWVQEARRHGITNIAAHAFLEPATHTLTHVCLADVPGGPTARHAQLLRLLLPHLHAPLVRVAGIGAHLPVPVPRPELHPHQLEILRWLHVGKTNWEISMILGLSVHNVKYHVAQLLVKLEAANRVHAVARARECGLLDDRPPTLRSVPGAAPR